MNIRTIVIAGDIFFSEDKCPDSSIVLYCAMSSTRSGMNWISGPAKTAPVVSKTSFAAMVLPNATINLTKKTATELSFWDFRCSRMNLCKLNMLLQLHSCAFYGYVDAKVCLVQEDVWLRWGRLLPKQPVLRPKRGLHRWVRRGWVRPLHLPQCSGYHGSGSFSSGSPLLPGSRYRALLED